MNLDTDMRKICSNVTITKPHEPVITTHPSAWAREAWDWAIKNGITDSTNPQTTATREQAAQMMYNFVKNGGRE